MTKRLGLVLLLMLGLLAAASKSAAAAVAIKEPWPDPATLGDVAASDVSFPSTSPFSPYDLGRGKERQPPTTALARLSATAAPPSPIASSTSPRP